MADGYTYDLNKCIDAGKDIGKSAPNKMSLIGYIFAIAVDEK